MCTLKQRRPGRGAFTLVEMLVVLFILVVLATLAVALVPRLGEQQKATRGADQVSGWLLIAKQRARRDRHPVGVRLQVPLVALSTAAVSQTGSAVTVSYTPWSPVTNRPDPTQSLGTGTVWVLAPGSYLVVADNDQGWNPEVVRVQSVGPNSFTAVYQQAHPANFRIRHLGYVQTLQYVEQPEDYQVTAGPPFGVPGGAAVRRLSLLLGPPPAPSPPVGLYADLEPYPAPPGPPPPPAIPPDFTGGLGWQGGGAPGTPDPTTAALWPVGPGDYLELLGGGQVHEILGVDTSLAAPFTGGPFGSRLLLYRDPLWSPPPPADGSNVVLNATDQYRILRGPRPLRGEADLLMPQSVVIDLGTNWMFSAANNNYTVPLDPLTGTIDILFAPSGAVTGRGAQGAGPFSLWVRDAVLDTPGDVAGNIWQGEPALVTLYPRTGFIATQPVDPNTPNNPYTFTQDGRSSGM